MQQQPGMMMQQPGGPPGPGGGQWMPPPARPADCPPGLEYLGLIDQILCKQKKELAEIIFGWESNNRYVMKNSMGQQIYRVEEETSCMMRMCCGPNRGFVLHIFDNSEQEVMRVVREFKCCAGCCWCANCGDCAFEVRVEAPPGVPVGYTRQLQSCWSIELEVMNERKESVFEVHGPCCPCKCCADVEFPVVTKEGQQQIGKIAKQWTGMLKETFTDADNFNVSFPVDLDIKMKASLIGTLFLVDFMAFEQQNQGMAQSLLS